MPLSMTALTLAVIAGNLPLLFLPRTNGRRAVRHAGCRRTVATERPPHGEVSGGGGADAGLERLSRPVIAATQDDLESGESDPHSPPVTLNLTADKAPERLVARVSHINGQRVFPPVAVALLWRSPPARWCAGQQRRLRVALQPVHGRMNEGGFDSQRWALAPLRKSATKNGNCSRGSVLPI